ncbi:CDP-diacylglycerol--serine O-phosphatidyltransferase [Luteithermobacter gelatinilyticus]|uniref:CDP-diacylglycerol--serine O-phosphatidyltransferase n=1 Tax=Luteithermobacter gelatinilyticus TaxID=2582913 RepID=UPI001106E6E2|nr:CDP-diacylglycerol--serine O-phosphatidyltransferase [Luteithermobacter gelatinilyticus]
MTNIHPIKDSDKNKADTTAQAGKAAGDAARHMPIMPLRSLAPNVITVLALCSGMFGMRFAILGKWEAAVVAVIVAGIFDGLDGRVARLLKGASRFGAELDSLSDIVSFGVAPALIMYMWVLNDIKGVGWAVALAFVICMALRLARFNTAQGQEPSSAKKAKTYFTGIPSPAAAALSLWPMILSFETDWALFRNPIFCSAYVALIAFLAVSKIPTFSFKRLAIHREYVMFYFLGVAIFASLLVTHLWITLSVLGVFYLLSIPFAVRKSKTALKHE